MIATKVGVIWLGSVLLLLSCGALPVRSEQWKTGPALRVELGQGTRVTWEEAPLRDALARLASSNGVCIFLDRRVDPDQRVTFDSGDGSMEQLIQRLALHLEIGYCVIDSVVYLGPQKSALQLPALAAIQRDEVQARDDELARRWLRRREIAWPRLSEPKAIISDLLSEQDVALNRGHQLPHDVWPGGGLAANTLIDQLTLLLVGFDMMCQWDEDSPSPRIVPIPDDPMASRVYKQPRAATVDLDGLRRMFPDSQIRRTGHQLQIAGPLQDHTQIERLLTGQSRRVVQQTDGSKVYTLENVEAPAGSVVATVARQLGLEIRYEGDAAERLRERVKVNVKDVPIEELLEAALGPVEVAFELNERELVLRPAD